MCIRDRVKAASPGTVTIGRLSVEPQGYGGEPEAAAAALVAQQLPQLIQHPYVDCLLYTSNHPALWRGGRRTLFLDSATQTYAYAREDGHEALVVGLNMSDEPRTLVVPYVERGTKITFELPPWTGDVASV